MLTRTAHLRALKDLLRQFPVVALLGARQVGKSTLARQLAAKGKSAFFDLEDPRDRQRLAAPLLALEELRGLVVLDEIHHLPEVFPVLRVLADRRGPPARFLVLGSAAPELLKQSSETLAGRIAYHFLPPFHLEETGVATAERLWLRGGFPLSFLAADDAASLRWRRQFIRTFLARDLRDLGLLLDPPAMERFWTMLAHCHGQIWNASELARSFGVTQRTVNRYLDVLETTFMARRLRPWHENLAKRQVRMPKIYLRDSGLAHALLGVADATELWRHPKVGASWEGCALEQVIGTLRAEPEECYFWALHTGAELDLLVVRGRRRLGFEFKLSDAPAVTPSMRSAQSNLALERLDVIHAGPHTFPLADSIRAVSLRRLLEDVPPLA